MRDTCPEGSLLEQISYSVSHFLFVLLRFLAVRSAGAHPCVCVCVQSCPRVIDDVFAYHAPLVLGWFLGISGIMVSPSGALCGSLSITRVF